MRICDEMGTTWDSSGGVHVTQLDDVERMYMRNYLRDGQRHLDAAILLHENEFHDYCVKEAYESMLWHVDALLLTVEIRTFKSSTAIASFGKEFVKKDIYPTPFYEHLLLANASYRIADSEFSATISRDEATSILGFARGFRDIVAYLKDLGLDQGRGDSGGKDVEGDGKNDAVPGSND